MLNPSHHTVSAVTIRLSGRVESRTHLQDAGTTEAAVTIQIGDTLCRVADVYTMNCLLFAWHCAQGNAEKLPARALPQWLGVEPGLHRVGVIVDLVGEQVHSVAYIPARSDDDVPAYTRIQFGPLIWQVTDRVAYNRVKRELLKARNMLPHPLA